MKTEEIKRMQRRVGTTPDGFWGPLSIAACQAHLRKLMAAAPQVWPKADQGSLTAFYGLPGDERQLVTIRFPYRMFYDGKVVLSTRCHRKVADSLLRVLTEIGDRWGNERGIMEEAEDYGGVYNPRPMRGGSLPSLHARGAAIDLDADDNGNLMSWPVAADMPIEIMEAFAREGWLSAGAFWGRDAMHFQATK
jgi:hypothetical protein